MLRGLFLIILLFSFGCTLEKSKGNLYKSKSEKEKINESKKKDSINSQLSYLDKDLITSFYKIIDIDKDSFYSLKRNNIVKKLKKEKENKFINKKDSIFYFKYFDNTTDSLVSNLLTEKGDEYIGYTFYENYDNLNLVHFNIEYYESNEELLINLKSKKKYYLWNSPIFSKDSSKIFITSYDMIANYTYNGFQYFKVSNDSLQNVFEKDHINWGVENAFWISNNKIGIERKRPDYESSNDKEIIRYSILELND